MSEEEGAAGSGRPLPGGAQPPCPEGCCSHSYCRRHPCQAWQGMTVFADILSGKELSKVCMAAKVWWDELNIIPCSCSIWLCWNLWSSCLHIDSVMKVSLSLKRDVAMSSGLPDAQMICKGSEALGTSCCHSANSYFALFLHFVVNTLIMGTFCCRLSSHTVLLYLSKPACQQSP